MKRRAPSQTATLMAAIAILLSAMNPTWGRNTSCGYKASSWFQSKTSPCESSADCFRVFAYSDPSRTIPVTVYSVESSNPLDWVGSTDDCADRYTKENYYNCDTGIFSSSCLWNSPLASNPQNGFEPSRCRLVTKGNCQNTN